MAGTAVHGAGGGSGLMFQRRREQGDREQLPGGQQVAAVRELQQTIRVRVGDATIGLLLGRIVGYKTQC
eukprot:1028358-Pyramimonas_sp.AAC.1